ncbi:22728_t:CDS:1, partial [Gigaspora rosea]
MDFEDVQQFPLYLPPKGWKQKENLNQEKTKFDTDDINNDENEIWIFKLPPNISKEDLVGKTLTFPKGTPKLPNKVAKFEKSVQINKKRETATLKYNIQELPINLTQEFEILLPSQKDDVDLVLSNKKPTKFFNITRKFNRPNPKSNIETILKDYQKIPQQPPETFIPRIITNYSEFPNQHINEAITEKKRFEKKLMDDWQFNNWKKEIKKHNKVNSKAYLTWKESCILEVNKSKQIFAERLAEKKLLIDDDQKIEKRKFISNGDEIEDENEYSKSIKKKKDYVKKKGKSSSLSFKTSEYQDLLDYDSDADILAEVAEEEAAFAKMASDQMIKEEKRAKELQNIERETTEIWTPALVTYPKYEPPTTWWSKMNDEILDEVEKIKLKPRTKKRDWTGAW